jgi:hypothetical protein
MPIWSYSVNDKERICWSNWISDRAVNRTATQVERFDISLYAENDITGLPVEARLCALGPLVLMIWEPAPLTAATLEATSK